RSVLRIRLPVGSAVGMGNRSDDRQLLSRHLSVPVSDEHGSVLRLAAWAPFAGGYRSDSPDYSGAVVALHRAGETACSAAKGRSTPVADNVPAARHHHR